MRFLLPIMELLFFAPVVMRVAGRHAGASRSEVLDPLKSLRDPGVIVHCIGGALLFVATAIGLAGATKTSSLRAVAGVLIITGGSLLLAASLHALRSWRFLPEITHDHQLCTSGPYAYVRHPNYVALDLLGIGAAIWLPTPWMLMAGLLLIVGGEWRARAEERALLAAFGDRYRTYMDRVRRFIPGVY